MAGTRIEDIKPLVWREFRRTPADLDHSPVRSEADVNDDLLRIHSVSFFGTFTDLRPEEPDRDGLASSSSLDIKPRRGALAYAAIKLLIVIAHHLGGSFAACRDE
ncbi:hypothetical protein AS156_35720 [Bradyrhizobium macuxiense]|uniref:Uncharacterized protein n=1 Tax=Bradyrhizobium macuxiense TaxID=1755647 RepID=A0A109JZS4_9BRAD|nr:hypothetical protein [Bradyrhizobium macuxiense]KWV58164.1 hypothetical protein AS156_35720 [Bradyrhizobium macuxiense]